MGKRQQLIIPVLLMLCIFFTSDGANGAKHTQFLKVKPHQPRSSPDSFFGFLPKGVPIPPSAPSERHNSIGLDGGGGAPWMIVQEERNKLSRINLQEKQQIPMEYFCLRLPGIYIVFLKDHSLIRKLKELVMEVSSSIKQWNYTDFNRIYSFSALFIGLVEED